EALGLEAAGAVEGLLAVDVAFDLAAAKLAEAHHGGVERRGQRAAAGDCHGGAEGDRASRHTLQLGDRRLAATGFAQGDAVEVRDLVRTDYARARTERGHGPGLGLGKAQRQCGRGLARTWRLVHFGPDGI